MSVEDVDAVVGRRRGSALLVAPSPPGAAVGSGSRAAIVLAALRERFSRVDVVALSAWGDERRSDPAVHLVPWAARRSRWAYATSVFRGGSPFVGVRASGLAARLRGLRERRQLCAGYELVWSHFLITAPAALGVPAIARVLDADFSLAAAARRALGGPGAGLLQRAYLRLDAAAIAGAEQRLSGMFDRIVVASELERERVGATRAPVAVVPNAVPGPDGGLPPACRRHGMLFVGSLDYDVNVDAVGFLVREVFPLIRARLPAAELVIAGRNPGPSLLALARSPGVKVIADPPSLDPLYAGARVAVAPLSSGGGTRIKLLEAMARSLAIVATPTAVEGLRLRDRVSVLLGAGSQDLASHCIALLEDAALADRIGQGGHAVWNADHQPAVARAAILDVLDSLSALCAGDAAPSG